MKNRVRYIAKLTFTFFILIYFNSSTSKEYETIKFSFSPGENISFTQKLTATKVKDMGNKGKQVDVSISSTLVSMAKTNSGWNVRAEPKSIYMKRNGVEVNNPIVKLLSSVVMTYRLDNSGRILDVKGLEPFIEGLSKQMPPEVFKQLAPILNIEVMKAKEMAEWNGRIGDYVGESVQIGDQLVADVPYQIPGGTTINYTVKTNIAAFVPCGNNKCVRIEQFYDSQADSVAKMAGDVVSNVTEALAPELRKSGSESNTARIKGNVTRVIDPDTMLIYGEESSRTIEMEIDIPGMGLVPTKTTETRIYEFVY